ncbi:MAG: hypothetical protein F4Z34_01895 [Acidimicrobiaceae bacterium]|nr:hypothetical protein [Acidimicrobiaceae bacterium]
MSYETSYQGTGMPDDDTREPSSRRRVRERIDSVSVVSGLVFIAIALAALTDRYWADIDAALVFGGAIVAIGVALMVSAVLRHRRRGQPDDGLAG